MKIIFDSVEMQNFLSVGHISFDLDEKGIISVIGENRTDSFSTSNGSGKSALIEAIIWCLTGATSRGIKGDDVINKYSDLGSGDCYVNVQLLIGDNAYSITRSRGIRNSLSIIKDGIDISGNTATKSQEILSGILPFGYEKLTSMIILSQGMPSKLSNQTPSGRKAILENMASYADTIENIKSKIKNSFDASTKLDSELKSKQNIAIVKMSGSLEKLAILEKQLETENDRVDNANAERAIMIKKNQDSEVEDNKLQEELNEKVMISSEANRRLVEYTSSIEPMYSELESIKRTLISEFNSRSLSKKRLDTYMNNKLSIENEGVCYTCGNPFTDKVKIQAELKSIEDGIAEIVRLEAESTSNTDRMKLRESELLKLLRESEVTLETLRAALKSAEESVSIVQIKKNKIMWYAIPDEKFPELERIKTQIEEVKDEYEANKLLNESLELEIVENQRIMKIRSRMQADITRGSFRNYVLELVVKAFNNILEEVSIPIMKDAPVSLVMDPEGTKLEIYYKDKKYEQMSGGEKTRIDIALELTRRKYDSIVSNVSFNLLVMDEVTDGMDSYGIASIFDAVMMTDNIDTYMVISHRDDNIDYNTKFRVIKENNISRLEVE